MAYLSRAPRHLCCCLPVQHEAVHVPLHVGGGYVQGATVSTAKQLQGDPAGIPQRVAQLPALHVFLKRQGLLPSWSRVLHGFADEIFVHVQ